jgi:hypothetical protein
MFRLGEQAMPHFGLMNERELGPVAGPLQRARLHLRGGKRRLRQGKVSAGIVTLYDALEGAMLSYAESPDTGPGLQFLPGERRYDSKVLYAVLVRSGVLDGSFDFEAFDQLTEQALNQELVDYDTRDLLSGVESVMTQLGVLPFDETGLPPEDPSTF